MYEKKMAIKSLIGVSPYICMYIAFHCFKYIYLWVTKIAEDIRINNKKLFLILKETFENSCGSPHSTNFAQINLFFFTMISLSHMLWVANIYNNANTENGSNV